MGEEAGGQSNSEQDQLDMHLPIPNRRENLHLRFLLPLLGIPSSVLQPPISRYKVHLYPITLCFQVTQPIQLSIAARGYRATRGFRSYSIANRGLRSEENWELPKRELNSQTSDKRFFDIMLGLPTCTISQLNKLLCLEGCVEDFRDISGDKSLERMLLRVRRNCRRCHAKYQLSFAGRFWA